MKNFFAPFLIIALAFSFFNFTIPQNQQQRIIQSAIENSIFAEILEKDQNGKVVPFALASDYPLSEDTKLFFEENLIHLISPTEESTNSWQKEVLYLKGMKIKNDKATLWFTYGEKRVKIKVNKVEGDWKFKYGSAKSKGFFIMYLTE